MSNTARAIHPFAKLFPPMEGEEFDALVADIKAHGLREPTVITHDDQVLDGRNRESACIEAGVKPLYRLFDGGDPLAFVISANIHRRHLTAEKKREIIAELIKAQPEKSNRQIAKIAKVDDKTVAAVRAEKEATAEFPQLEKTVGADGKARKRPVKKVPVPAPEPAPQVARGPDNAPDPSTSAEAKAKQHVANLPGDAEEATASDAATKEPNQSTRAVRTYDSHDLTFRGNDLRCACKTIVSIAPDQTYSGMWRVAHPDGRLSDMVNKTRAKDAAVTIALSILNSEGEETASGARRARSGTAARDSRQG